MSLDATLTATPRDDAVEFALTVTNTGSAPVTLTYRSGMDADFVVRDGSRERWRYSDGRMFTQAIREQELEPGEETTAAAEWPDPAPGSYEIEATLAADPGARAETTLDVP